MSLMNGVLLLLGQNGVGSVQVSRRGKTTPEYHHFSLGQRQLSTDTEWVAVIGPGFCMSICERAFAVVNLKPGFISK